MFKTAIAFIKAKLGDILDEVARKDFSVCHSPIVIKHIKGRSEYFLKEGRCVEKVFEVRISEFGVGSKKFIFVEKYKGIIKID